MYEQKYVYQIRRVKLNDLLGIYTDISVAVSER